mmetsp:Transcript_19956/g.50777  ORF Transcript_19956/g.50777 Transcript_19956/m.50777 type:complete len:239 (-) Transcript_19956:2-718(-)
MNISHRKAEREEKSQRNHLEWGRRVHESTGVGRPPRTRLRRIPRHLFGVGEAVCHRGSQDRRSARVAQTAALNSDERLPRVPRVHRWLRPSALCVALGGVLGSGWLILREQLTAARTHDPHDVALRVVRRTLVKALERRHEDLVPVGIKHREFDRMVCVIYPVQYHPATASLTALMAQAGRARWQVVTRVGIGLVAALHQLRLAHTPWLTAAPVERLASVAASAARAIGKVDARDAPP